ncbi:unnamed protein product [Larinioides sclopetarius]|uniref:CRAL-TRIO domain-containing protein n=1 Tax=Larinioides sclopetarius TaxID=280406 RepID=A0AAV1YT23_9ARAC
MSSKHVDEKGEKILPFQMDCLPEFVLTKSEKELNETIERRVESLQELRTVLQKNQTTSGIDFHNDLMVQFLRRNKYRIRQTVKNIQNFVSLNRKESWLFKSIPDDCFTSKPATNCVLLLPKRCPDGCTLILSQCGKWNPDELSFEYLMQLIMMLFTQLLRDPMTQINGFKLIHDFRETTFQQLKYATPYNMYLFCHTAFNCLPGRYKEIHFINESFVLKALWMILKPFLSQKIKSRIYFHSSTEELFDYFPRSVIPVEYGGELSDSDLKDWIRNSNEDFKQYVIEGRPNYY